LSTDLARTTNVETSLETGLLQSSFSLCTRMGNVGRLQTFHLVDFHCYLLHED
jgi:hypothetical protein